MNALFDLPANNDTTDIEFERVEYVDPHPDLKGSDKVWEECGWCTNGVYTGPGNVHWKIGKVDTTWCFQCNGNGGSYVKVSSIRARVRRHVNETNKIRRQAAEYEATKPQRDLEEWIKAWDAAHAEQARRAALVTGFVGEIGDRIKNLEGTVTVRTSFEVPSFRGYGTDYKAFVVITLDNGQVIKTSGTGQSLFDVERNDRVKVTGTVKGYDNYNGQDQTTLTRVKLVKIEN